MTILAAAALVLAVAVVPALADSQTVTAGGSTWSKSSVAIKPGESVTFDNPVGAGGFHNLWIDGSQVQSDGAGWSYTANGLAAGEHAFSCTIHANMTGKIYVNDTGTVPAPPPPPPPPPTTTPTTTPTTSTPTTTTPGSGGTGAGSPQVSLARRSLGAFCVGGSGCKHPGVVVALALDRAATVELVLSRSDAKGRFRAAGRVERELAAGRSSIRFTRTGSGRLKAGRYRATLTATATDTGVATDAGNILFTVR